MYCIPKGSLGPGHPEYPKMHEDSPEILQKLGEVAKSASNIIKRYAVLDHLFEHLETISPTGQDAGYAKRPAASVKCLGRWEQHGESTRFSQLFVPRSMLRKKAAATPSTPEGQLLKAARSGSLMSVMRLLQMGVDPNVGTLALSEQHYDPISGTSH